MAALLATLSSVAAWYLRNSNTRGIGEHSFRYGDPGDNPLVGDWDGDGVHTVAVVRGHLWHLRRTNTTGPGELTFGYGDAGDTPLTWR